jgi:hypothetical protein
LACRVRLTGRWEMRSPRRSEEHIAISCDSSAKSRRGRGPGERSPMSVPRAWPHCQDVSGTGSGGQ